MSNAATIEDLLEERAIQRVITLYFHGIDRRDEPTLRDVFWPDANLVYGIFNGTATQFIDFLMPWFKEIQLGPTLHTGTNVLIVREGNKAVVEHAYNAYHSCRDPKTGKYNDVVVAGRYTDEFEKRQGVWRISYRRVLSDWFREYPDTGDWNIGTFGNNYDAGGIGKPGPDDDPRFAQALDRWRAKERKLTG